MNDAGTTRRGFLVGGLTTMTGGALARRLPVGTKPGEVGTGGPADVTLRIAPLQIEIAKGRTIRTTGYNGSVPGPLIRFQEGVPAAIQVFNETGNPEYVHWHGLNLSPDLDGAEEEGSLVVPAHGHLRYVLKPEPSGARYVHTHAMSMSDLTSGVFSGQFAFVYIDPKKNPGKYDLEVFLATHEWDPHLTTMEQHPDSDAEHQTAPETPADADGGWEVAYRYFTINGTCLGHGEPVRVKEGQRALFHILNASATESVRLALPGHRFQVIALDGNPVPRPELVEVLELGTAERVDALVEMNSPGVWILGTPRDSHRRRGMGIVIEYANRSGKPRWIKPVFEAWDYAQFGAVPESKQPDETIPIVIRRVSPGEDGFERWTLNGRSFDNRDEPHQLSKGRRYRLVLDNRSDDAHPVHLHRNSFEVVSLFGKATSGLIKDVIVVNSSNKVEVDVTPGMSGLMLFHCHQQLHMDHGFKMLFNVT